MPLSLPEDWGVREGAKNITDLSCMTQLILSELNVYLFCFALSVLLRLVPRAQIKFILTAMLASTDLRQNGP